MAKALTYIPRNKGLAPCSTKSTVSLCEAAEALGETLVFGSELSFELRSLQKNPLHPFHGASDPEAHQAFVLLQAMLIAERWLIEFLLGPPGKGTKKRPDDVCVDCFIPDWRFPAGSDADELFRRCDRINKLVMHPTWELIDFSPRVWTLNLISNCIVGFEGFASAVVPKYPKVANILTSHIAAGKAALQHGRSDGSRWLSAGFGPEYVPPPMSAV